jgi:hypothetical protein
LSRGDRWCAVAIAAGAAALALGGCMRIYPDPELPDVAVEWEADFECSEAGDRVVVSLSSLDPAADIGTLTVPCRDGSARFDDVERLRYFVAAKLEDSEGMVLGSQDEEIDLRDGLSKRFFAFFGRAPESNFRVGWTFDMGASCESLSATSVQLFVEIPGMGPFFFFQTSCDAAVFMNAIPRDGMYTLTARAVAIDTVVAVSAESAPFTITRGTLTDVGTLTLSPCGTACEQLRPQ